MYAPWDLIWTPMNFVRTFLLLLLSSSFCGGLFGLEEISPKPENWVEGLHIWRRGWFGFLSNERFQCLVVIFSVQKKHMKQREITPAINATKKSWLEEIQ